MSEWLQPLRMEKHAPLEPGEWWALVGVCVALVTFAGLASGLTLGLMSLDAVDREVRGRLLAAAGVQRNRGAVEGAGGSGDGGGHGPVHAGGTAPAVFQTMGGLVAS